MKVRSQKLKPCSKAVFLELQHQAPSLAGERRRHDGADHPQHLLARPRSCIGWHGVRAVTALVSAPATAAAKAPSRSRARSSLPTLTSYVDMSGVGSVRWLFITCRPMWMMVVAMRIGSEMDSMSISGLSICSALPDERQPPTAPRRGYCCHPDRALPVPGQAVCRHSRSTSD